MKHYILSLLALLLCFAGTAAAAPVDSTAARRVATTYMRAQGMKHPETLVNITAETPFTEFYLFADPDGGFVLVSADDCVLPVLGYSIASPFVAEAMPDHIRGMLEGYEKEIRWWKRHAAQHTETPSDSLALMWSMLVDGTMPTTTLTTSVAPMLTTTWGQSPYYNNLCPYDDAGGTHVVTGCVATATGQVMKYWNYPATGYGSHSYDASNSTSDYGTLSANFGATTYQWSIMPNSLSASSSTAELNAVATLLYHIGVADEMGYNISSRGGSGAHNFQYNGRCMPSSQYALNKYFKYRPDMTVLSRADYSNAEFTARLRSELDLARPILYSGFSRTGGHSFVLDGYNTDGQFHVNWGWRGSCDGYFVIGALNPYGGGDGSNSSGTYNLSNTALLGIRPNTSWSANATTTVVVNKASGSPFGATVSGGGTYAMGDTVTLLAKAPTGYRFDKWSDGTKQNPREFVASGGSYTFTANYVSLGSDTLHYCPGWCDYTSYGSTTEGDDKYWGIRLPASVLPSNKPLTSVQIYIGSAGTYDLTVYKGSSHNTVVATATATYTEDDEGEWHAINLATPVTSTQDLWIIFHNTDAGYPAAVTYYSGTNGSLLWGSTFYDYSSSWQASCLIRAVFGSHYTLNVESNNDAWGTVSGGGGYPAGTTVQIQAYPNSGYLFDGWDDGNTDNPRTVTVNADITYTALFSCSTVTNFPYDEGFEGGLGCWMPVDNNNDNSTWRAETSGSHNGNGLAVSYSYLSGTRYNVDEYLISPLIVLPASHDVTLSWWFKVRSSWPADKLAVKVSTTGTAVSDFTTTLFDITPTSEHGTWTQQSIDLSAYAGQSIYLAFHHHDAYDEYSISIDDIHIETTFVERYTVSLNANNSSWGTATGGGTYDVGALVTLTATPAAGYHFTQWNDGNTANPRTVTVGSNLSLMALFAPDIYQVTLGSTDAARGSVEVYHSGSALPSGVYATGTAGVYRVLYNTQVSFVAMPANSCYYLASWSNGAAVDATGRQTVTVTADMTLSASFAEQIYSGDTSARACEKFVWHGTTYTASTNAPTYCYHTVADGCDSVVTLHLRLNHDQHSHTYVTHCGPYTWAVNGKTYNQSGDKYYKGSTPEGCVRRDTLTLNVFKGYAHHEEVTHCGPYTWDVTGKTYNKSGVKTCKRTAEDGCPTYDTLTLTVVDRWSSHEEVSSCGPYTWDVTGRTYNKSGNKYYKGTADDGCPQYDTLTLTIVDRWSNHAYDTSCGPYTWAVNGVTYNKSGNKYYKGTADDGCPSYDTLTLTIVDRWTSHAYVTSSGPYTWEVNGRTYNQSGVKTYKSYPADDGCPHYDTLTLTINNCDKNPENNSQFSTLNSQLSIYPNPTTGLVNIDVKSNSQLSTLNSQLTVELLDLVGRRVECYENTRTLDLSHLANGTYTLRVTLPDGVVVRKIVKR